MGEELGWDEARRAREVGRLPRSEAARRKASCPAIRRNFRASRRLEPGGAPRPGAVFATPSRSSCSSSLLAVPRRRARGLVPGRADRRPERRRRRGRQRRPRPRRRRRGRLPAQRRRRPARVRLARCSAAPGARRSASTPRPARRPRSRSRSATATGSRSPGSPTATSTPTSPRAATRPGRVRRPGRRSAARTRTSLDIDLGVNGAAYAIWQQDGDVARRAPAGRDLDARSPPPLDVDPDARGRHRRAAAEGRRLAPRATRSSTWGDDRRTGSRACGRAGSPA